MKPVRIAILAIGVAVLGMLTVAAQTSRSAAERAASDSRARDVTFRAVGPMGAASPLAAAAVPVVFGAIGTAAIGGVPTQVFAHRTDVFLTVGPTAVPCAFPAFLPDGKYYFQVTDPSGRVLLSTDPVSERAFTVKGGVIATYDGTTHATDGKTACGSLAIGVSPYNDPGPRKAVAIVWVTPTAAFEGTPSQADPVCGSGCFHGFHVDSSLTAGFRVEDKPSCDDSFCISGVAFNDANGNGVRDAGEAGLAGVPVRVENVTGAVLTGLSGSDGSFQICGLAGGEDFRVTSPAPLGFNTTGPLGGVIARRVFARDFAYVIEVCMDNVANVNFPSQAIPGTIGGFKFEDLNANSARDPGEPPLAGFTIQLTSSSGGPAQTQVTAADGSFLFTGLAAGTYTLTELPPTAGFTQTLPASDGITVNLAANGSSVNNLFGNFHGILTGTISGTKFNDLNGNGVRDAGEPGLAGVTIRLFPPICPLCVPVATTTTAADGSFSFANVALGGYAVVETVPSGFRQTAPPAPGEIAATLSVSQRSVTGLLFGNQAIGGSISGTKFNDANGNGVRDAGEGGVSGVTIQARDSTGQLAGTVQTDASGNFTLANLPAGTYKISEVLTSGFAQTTPGGDGTITVTLTSGQTVTGLLFGNQVATASISGTKFNDVNGNGARDAGEAGVAGITINLLGPNALTRSTTTDASGAFTFSSLPAGAYTLSEVVPAGSVQTTPGGAGTISVTLTAGQIATGSLFGNRAAAGTASISGTKIFDVDANGVVNGLDHGLEGVTITLKDLFGGVVQTVVTGADGTFVFSGLAAGTYNLSEVIPSGFSQTFPGTLTAPKSYTITLTVGQQATGFLFLNKC